jgi:hypothetical protein
MNAGERRKREMGEIIRREDEGEEKMGRVAKTCDLCSIPR